MKTFDDIEQQDLNNKNLETHNSTFKGFLAIGAWIMASIIIGAIVQLLV